jgi:hypothetical protein
MHDHVHTVTLAVVLVLFCRFNLRETATGPIIGNGVITGTFYNVVAGAMPTYFANEVASIVVRREIRGWQGRTGAMKHPVDL